MASSDVPVTDALSDDAIVERVRAGEVDLYELLMRRHNRRLYRAARAILGRVDDDEVLDVVQDAFVRAYVHLGSFEGRSQFSTWLTRIAVHEALARRRRLRAERPGAAAPEEDTDLRRSTGEGSDPERHAARREIRHVIEAAVDSLPENFRTVFMLRAVEELSVAETAGSLEIPEETVKTRLHRARGLLQQALLPQVEVGAPGAFPFEGARCDRVVAAVLGRIQTARS